MRIDGGMPSTTSGVRLFYADLTSSSPGITNAAGDDVTGLTGTFTATVRPVALIFQAVMTHSIASGKALITIRDSANTEVGRSRWMGDTVAGGALLAVARCELPTTGYALTPGTSYTFKITVAAQNSGTVTLVISGAQRPQFTAILL